MQKRITKAGLKTQNAPENRINCNLIDVNLELVACTVNKKHSMCLVTAGVASDFLSYSFQLVYFVFIHSSGELSSVMERLLPTSKLSLDLGSPSLFYPHL